MITWRTPHPHRRPYRGPTLEAPSPPRLAKLSDLERCTAGQQKRSHSADSDSESLGDSHVHPLPSLRAPNGLIPMDYACPPLGAASPRITYSNCCSASDPPDSRLPLSKIASTI